MAVKLSELPGQVGPSQILHASLKDSRIFEL